MGLVIQRIEPNGRVDRDGRLRAGDRIIEINGTSLIGIDFIRAQEILREAIRNSCSSSSTNTTTILQHPQLEMKVVRLLSLEAIDTSQSSATLEPIETNKPNESNSETQPQSAAPIGQQSTNLSALNTKKIGKRVTIELVKGAQGLGFKLAARDNCAQGEFSPIYIKNILPKGAAITDGRLQRGDRLLEVDDMDMTKRTLHEAVNILRNTQLGATVKLVVSRQVIEIASPESTESRPLNVNEDKQDVGEEREIRDDDDDDDEDTNRISQQEETTTTTKKKTGVRKQLLTLEIALNETGSAGLGVSVKGKTKRMDDESCLVDLGIFIKTVINGGAASKDGRLRPNDQLVNINGFSLLGKSNEEAMTILREAMMVESRPGHIELTVSRKIRPAANQQLNPTNEVRQTIVKIVENDNEELPPTTSRFNRDAPNRRSMSEKRAKLGNVPAQFAQSLTSSAIHRVIYIITFIIIIIQFWNRFRI